MIVRIATRRSALALAQARWVAAQLEALEPGVTVELREYVTRGDRIRDVPLSRVGGKGLFTREIEQALLDGEADLAVHSLKDLPAGLPPGLVLAAVPPREDPHDAVVLPAGRAAEASPRLPGPPADGLALLPRGARVGTSSLRRCAQLRAIRPDLRVEPLRGNVDTRLRKLDAGEFDAVILAAAGLRRLDLEHRIAGLLPVEVSTPAPGQGALAIQAREADRASLSLARRLDDANTRRCILAERALMEAIGGGCHVPLGAFARAGARVITLHAVLAAPDGSRLVRQSAEGPATEPERLGRYLAEELLAAGGREILASLSPE